MKKVFISIGCLLALFGLFLIALGDRYEVMSERTVFDKWRCVVIVIQTDELPVIVNGKDTR